MEDKIKLVEGAMIGGEYKERDTVLSVKDEEITLTERAYLLATAKAVECDDNGIPLKKEEEAPTVVEEEHHEPEEDHDQYHH